MVKRAKWPVSLMQSLGREALALAERHRAALEPRLPPGLLDTLRRELDVFDNVRSAADIALSRQVATTLHQREALTRALDFLRAVRHAVRRSATSEVERGAFGISKRIAPNVVVSVLGALDAFIGGATQKPRVLPRAGLLPSDIETARALRAELIAIDQTQEKAKSERKTPTREREEAQLRIEAAIDSIHNAGRVHFALRPEVLATFKALIPGGRGRRRAKTVKV